MKNSSIIISNNLIDNLEELSYYESNILISYIEEVEKLEREIIFGSDEKLSQDDIIEKLRESGDIIIEVDVKSLIKDMGVSKSTAAYTYMSDALKKFSEKGVIQEIILPQGKKKFIVVPFIRKGEYIQGKSIISIKVNEDVLYYLVGLDREYTKIVIENIRKLNTASQIRLYTILKRAQGMVKYKISFDTFKELMYVINKKTGKMKSGYKNRANIEARLIKPNIEAINNKTDIKVSYEITGHGERAQIQFIIKPKHKKTDEKEELDNNLIMLSSLEVGEENKEKYIEFIKENINNRKNSSEITNINAYIRSCILNPDTKELFIKSLEDKKETLKKDLNKELEKYYADIRKEEEDSSNLRKELIYSDLPEIDEADRKLNDLFRKKAQALFSKDQVSDIDEEIKSITERKNKILNDNGYPLAFYERRYRCSLCDDTGYSKETGQLCSCREERLAELKRKMGIE